METQRLNKERRGQKMPALSEHNHGYTVSCDFRPQNVPKIFNNFEVREERSFPAAWTAD
jgi:hypothetical protein